MILNCEKKNPNEIIGLTNSDITPSEVLEIYKKYNLENHVKNFSENY